MVRINILPCSLLLDQHLNAENVELLMLKNSIPNLKAKIPLKYSLGKGHILFFSNKPNYLTFRQYEVKIEMIKRGFKNSLNLPLFKGENEFNPQVEDFKIIIKRLIDKVTLKPDYYNYLGQKINSIDYINFLNYLLTLTHDEIIEVSKMVQIENTFINLSVIKNRLNKNTNIYKGVCI